MGAGAGVRAFGKIDTDCCLESLLVNSHGLWAEDDNLLAFSVPLLLLQIAMIIFVNNIIHFPLSYLRIPKVSAQLITGLILGPLFNKLDKAKMGTVHGEKVELRLFSMQSQEILGTVSTFGFILYFFIWGVRIDMSLVPKVGRRSLAIALLSLVVPLSVGSLLSVILNKIKLDNFQLGGHYFPLVEYSAMSSFPVVATLLGDLKMINSELGRHVLSSSIICDTISLAFYGFLMCFFTKPRIRSFLGTAAFLLIVVIVIRPMIKWVIKQTPEGRLVKDGYVAIVIIGTLLSALILSYFGQVLTIAPFIIGLVIPDGPPMGFAIIQKLDSLVSDLLMPVFVTTCAMRVFLYEGAVSRVIVWCEISVVIITFSAKIIGAMLPAVLCGIPAKDALIIALIMCARGTVEVGHYAIVRDRSHYDQDGYNVIIFATLIIASLLPNVVDFLYDPMRQYAGYNKRNVISLSPDQNPHMLLCVHKNENVSSFINLLANSSPTMERPVPISVLHLVELFGRSAPLLISHRKGTTKGESSYSQNVIDAFEDYKRRNPPGSVILQAFTSVAPFSLMHNDIGTLALNEDCSLIMIPFHRKWTNDGRIESEDNKLLALNRSILERAPCSVGIIIDRGSLKNVFAPSESTGYVSFLMIFFGGPDDREALSYAKRTIYGSHDVVLTVINFQPEYDEAEDGSQDREIMNEIIADQRHNQRVRILEEKVKDGPQTALIIRSIVDEYDLIIVGRRDGVESTQTSGLIEWSEFPELGAIGDLLASSDLETKASTLVVQQQKMARHK